MEPAERDRELVAHAAAKGGWLREPDVMGVRRTSLADEAGLPGDEFEVRAIAVAAGLVEREDALVNGRATDRLAFRPSEFAVAACCTAPFLPRLGSTSC
jgi:hypothetical protein